MMGNGGVNVEVFEYHFMRIYPDLVRLFPHLVRMRHPFVRLLLPLVRMHPF